MKYAEVKDTYLKIGLRADVIEAAGGACQLCGQPIHDYGRMHGRWRGAIDHIVPRTSGDAPNNSRENLRYIHLWCNSKRGPKGVTPDEAVIAAARIKYPKELREVGFEQTATPEQLEAVAQVLCAQEHAERRAQGDYSLADWKKLSESSRFIYRMHAGTSLNFAGFIVRHP